MGRKRFRILSIIGILCITVGLILKVTAKEDFASKNLIQKIYNKYQNTESNTKNNYTPYLNCLGGKTDFTDDKFSPELLELRNKLISYVDNHVGFFYEDLSDGYTIKSSEDKTYYAASVNKLPLVYYAYKMADDNKIDLNEELTYTYKYKSSVGRGKVQYSEYNTKYKISTLLEYIIRYSDNEAYLMVLDHVKKENVADYFNKLGYKINYHGDNYGDLTATGGSIYAKLVYKYYLTGNDNAEKLVFDLKNALDTDTVLPSKANYEIAHKYGSFEEHYNDVSIVFSEYPYSVTILSTMGDTKAKDDYFLEVHALSNRFNNLYWEEKGNFCTSSLK